MNLYSPSTSLGLRNFTRYITNTNTATFPNADLDASLNMYYQLFVTEILQAMDGWDFGAEIATADTVAGQQEYTFPTTILKIKRIETTYDGINWVKVNSLDISEMSQAVSSTEFNTNSPFFDLMDNSLFLFPTPTSSIAGALKIWYEKEVTALTSDTDSPLIPEAFQKGLCYGAAKDYLEKYADTDESQRKWQTKWNIMKTNFDEILQRMKDFYSTREQDKEYFVLPADQGYDSEYGNF